MIHKMFAIHDLAAGAYLPPFTLHQPAMAVRAFANMTNDITHAFGKNPEDYSLYLIGEYDDTNSKIIPYDRELIATGIETIKGINDEQISHGPSILSSTRGGNTA